MKADQQRAKTIAQEGDALVKGKKYAEGRAKYVEALRFDSNPKYSMKISNVDLQIDNLIKKHLQAAESLFEKGRYQEALARLDETIALRPVDPAVLYNRALISYKLGQKAEAVAHLDRALGAIVGEKERIRLLQLRTQWETGEAVQQPPAGREDAIKELNEVLASGENAPDTCTKIRAVAAGVTRSASLVFNLAKCAEDDGKLEEASQLLDEYLTLAPEATDRSATQAGLDEARELEQRAGPQILALYGEADRAARSGYYKRAIDAMSKAIEAAPQIPETQLKLARLYQASDNATDARVHYTRYLEIEKREAQRAVAQQELASLEQRSAQYEAIMAPTRGRMLAWLSRYLVDGRPMGVAASQDELASIAKDLQQAAVMMPLAVDVNRLLGQVYLYDGNYPGARKAFTIVAESGAPIWFYAVVGGIDGWAKLVIAKVELRGPELRILGLARIEKKSYVPLLAATAENERIGGFLTPIPPDAAPASAYLATNALSACETDSDSVKVTWLEPAKGGGSPKERDFRLTPVRFVSAAPYNGPAARRFANPYTKLFRDFSDKKVKLGAEHLTGGEKFGMAMQVALAAYSGGAMSLASGVQGTSNIIAAAMRSATWATMELQNAMDTQTRMFQATQFKIMPIEDPKPVFRKELFR